MRWHAPVDPSCLVVSGFVSSLYSDPMSEGAPLDEIVEAFEAKHMVTCQRCQEFGAANVEVI